jgi:hypothetical protein
MATIPATAREDMSEPTCVDLRPWATANRYRWRYEQGHSSIEPDAEWYVEVICRHGLIYPKGGNILLAYANRGVKRHTANLAGVEHHQWDDDAEVFRFPAELLDDVAAILKPKKAFWTCTANRRAPRDTQTVRFSRGARITRIDAGSQRRQKPRLSLQCRPCSAISKLVMEEIVIETTVEPQLTAP